MTWVKQRKGWRMSCDVGEVMERLENQLILQLLRHFTYVTTHYPTLPSLYPRHSSFSNPSVASFKSQFILQPFFNFSYVTSSSLNSPGEPPMEFSAVSAVALSCINLLSHVKEPQAEIRAFEQNLSDFSRSMSEATLMT